MSKKSIPEYISSLYIEKDYTSWTYCNISGIVSDSLIDSSLKILCMRNLFEFLPIIPEKNIHSFIVQNISFLFLEIYFLCKSF